MSATDVTIGSGADAVSGLLAVPENARVLLVLAHGAGAGMRHGFLERIAAELAGCGVGTLRYQFPYMEQGRPRPDPPSGAAAAVRRAVGFARERCPDLTLIAGGKSFGGRMTSTAAAEAPLEGVRGIAFIGFPLHPPKRPGVSRAEHLVRVAAPMLFLQGTRDDLADLGLIRQVVSPLARARLHVVEGADHSFAVLRRSGRTNDEVMGELATTIAGWAAGL